MSLAFEQRLSEVCGSIHEVELRSRIFEDQARTARLRAEEAEMQAASAEERLAEAEGALEILLPELAVKECENAELMSQVLDLKEELADVRAARGNLASLAGLIDRERVDKARLQASLSTANIDRDAALADLSSAYADMQAMQAALLDSALHVRFLRAKLLEAQLTAAAGSDEHVALTTAERPRDPCPVAFSFDKTKAAIQAAVRDATALDKAESAKRIRLLRLRWHPDKNPELQEFASEVTKIINEAVDAMPH